MIKPSEKRLEKNRALYSYDSGFEAFGISLAGMDEAGRGPLLGPVVAACVIMPKTPILPWIDDSKKLSEKRREAVYEEIRDSAIAIGVGEASAEEIDAINILNATKLAMRRAAAAVPASLCLVDAVRSIGLPFDEYPIIHGDAVSYSIAAASIIAKVTRDRQLKEMALKYSQYGLERNKGYGTAEHMNAIRRFGPCPQHRRSFIGKLIGEENR